MSTKKHRWIWITAVVVLGTLGLAAWMAYTLTRIPPLDPQTLIALAQWIDQENEKQYGPTTEPQVQAFMNRWDEALRMIEDDQNTDPRIQRILKAPGWSPALEPDLSAVQQAYGTMVGEMDLLATHGVYYRLMQPQVEDWLLTHSERRSYSRPKVFDLYLTGHTLQTEQAIAQQEWEQALLQQNLYLQTSNLLRALPCDYDLSESLTRINGMHSFEIFLAPSVPAAVKRRIVLMLNEFQNQTNRYPISSLRYRWPIAQNQMTYFKSMWSNYFSRLYLLNSACMVAFENKDLFEDPQLTKLATKLETKQRPEGVPWRMISRTHLTPPQVLGFLRRVTKDRGWRTQFGFPSSNWEQYDPWTLLVVAASASLNEKNRIAREQVFQGRFGLMQCTMALQVYQQENGHWPASLAQALESCSTIDPNTSAMKDVRMQWLEPDPQVQAAIWGQSLEKLWALLKDTYPPASFDHAELESTISIEYGNAYKLIHLTAIKEMLESHPALAHDVQLLCGDRPTSGSQATAGPGDDGLIWSPLDPQEARRMVDWLDQYKWATTADPAKLPPDKRGENQPAKPEGPEPNLPVQLRLSARLSAPQRVLAVWHPGPDGVDNGARLAYDPTNGTASPGDLIVFPEGF